MKPMRKVEYLATVMVVCLPVPSDTDGEAIEKTEEGAKEALRYHLDTMNPNAPLDEVLPYDGEFSHALVTVMGGPESPTDRISDRGYLPDGSGGWGPEADHSPPATPDPEEDAAALSASPVKLSDFPSYGPDGSGGWKVVREGDVYEADDSGGWRDKRRIGD